MREHRAAPDAEKIPKGRVRRREKYLKSTLCFLSNCWNVLDGTFNKFLAYGVLLCSTLFPSMCAGLGDRKISIDVLLNAGWGECRRRRFRVLILISGQTASPRTRRNIYAERSSWSEKGENWGGIFAETGWALECIFPRSFANTRRADREQKFYIERNSTKHKYLRKALKIPFFAHYIAEV